MFSSYPWAAFKFYTSTETLLIFSCISFQQYSMYIQTSVYISFPLDSLPSFFSFNRLSWSFSILALRWMAVLLFIQLVPSCWSLSLFPRFCHHKQCHSKCRYENSYRIKSWQGTAKSKDMHIWNSFRYHPTNRSRWLRSCTLRTQCTSKGFYQIWGKWLCAVVVILFVFSYYGWDQGIFSYTVCLYAAMSLWFLFICLNQMLFAHFFFWTLIFFTFCCL